MVNIIPSEIEITFIRSSGPGGQNVNKVATAVQLRFNVESSSLPSFVKDRIKAEQKLTQAGDLIIKGVRFRTQERNKHDVLKRLQNIVDSASIPRKKRKKTKPTTGSIERRLDKKKIHAKAKALRQKPDWS